MTQIITIEGEDYRVVSIESKPDYDLVVAQRLEDQRPQGAPQTYKAFKLPSGAIEWLQ